MTAELGGFTGIVAPDEETVRFLRERRGIDFEIEPWMRSDEGARYAELIRIDCAAVTPMVAAPGDPGNGIPLGSLGDRAKSTSPTAVLAPPASAKTSTITTRCSRGRRSAACGCRRASKLYLQFGTAAVRDYCIAQGYLDAFERVGARGAAAFLRRVRELRPRRLDARPNRSRSARSTATSPGDPAPARSGSRARLPSRPARIAGQLLSFEELRGRYPG